MHMKKKLYQVNGAILIPADGFVRANSLEEAKQVYLSHLKKEAQGYQIGEEIHEIMSSRNKNYDKGGEPSPEEFEYGDVIIRSTWPW